MDDEERHTRAIEAVYIWRFGQAEFDERVFELRVAGVPVDVERTPLRVLRVLVEQPHRPVSQESLLDRVWRRTPDNISRTALPNAIRKLRRALGDDGQQLIVAVAGEGYLLAADVERKELPPLPSLDRVLKSGMAVPHRPDWRLQDRIDATDSSEVWLAEHSRSRDRRVFKFAGDGFHLTALRREVTIGRLLHEALGDRPEFVRIYDWNLDQPPYFIECDFGGVDLNRWTLSRGGLSSVSLQERLGIAAAMADGLATAHAVGVLHKDMKPANVLLDVGKDGKGRIRLADFGSGRLIEPEVLDQYNITRVTLPDADPTGTPLYIAPELLAGHPPTTGSDIYAVGVLLYQLVVGDFRRPISQGWEADIADELLREDIAAATHGNPQKRLPSAKLLAERLGGLDQRRTARAEEVKGKAEADAALEALRRTRARRPWLFGTGAILLVALSIVTWMYQRASVARDQTRIQYAVSQAVNQFLDTDLIAQADPFEGGNPDVRLRDALQKAEEEVKQRFAAQPEAEGSLRLALGHAWFGLTDYTRSADEFRRAIAAFEKSALSPLNGDGARPNASMDVAKLGLASALGRLGKFDEAKSNLEAVKTDLDAQKSADPRLYAEFYRVKAAVAMLKFDFKTAGQSFQQALDYAGRDTSFDLTQLDMIRDGLAESLSRVGQFDQALAVAKALGTDLERRKGALAYPTLKAEITEGTVYLFQNKFSDCERVLDPVVTGLTQVVGEQNEQTMTAMEDLSNCEYGSQNWQKSADLERRVYTQLLAKYGKENGHTMSTAINLGAVLARTGDDDEAITLLDAGYADAAKKFGAKHPVTETAAFFLADALLGKGQVGRAAQVLQGVSVDALNAAAPQSDWPGQLDFENARVAALTGQPEAATGLFKKALANLKQFDPADFWMTVAAEKYLQPKT